MTAVPLPEISEGEAEGNTAALYDDIRAVIGVPMVNLIFRHMATVPGCLDWAWGTIRPLYLSKDIPRAAAKMTADVMPGHAVDLRQPIAALNLKRSDVAAIDNVLDAYSRANPMNLIGLKIIDLALDSAPQNPGVGKAPALSADSLKTPVGLSDLLPMADPTTASAPTRDALDRLARQIHGGDTGVIPSLYRHFGAWPNFLNALEEALMDTFANDAFNLAVQNMQQKGASVAEDLYRDLPLPDMTSPDTSTTAALKDLIEKFPPNICRMTVLATVLRRGLPKA